MGSKAFGRALKQPASTARTDLQHQCRVIRKWLTLALNSLFVHQKGTELSTLGLKGAAGSSAECSHSSGRQAIEALVPRALPERVHVCRCPRNVLVAKVQLSSTFCCSVYE